MIKLFEEYNDIVSICDQYGIENYTINPDGSIDVNGGMNLNFNGRKLDRLPLKFGRVNGNFYCSHNKLTTLEGCPSYVGRYFSCSHNQLTSLEGGPKEVGSGFSCNNNKLTTLKGGPKEVGVNFDCSYNPLPDLIRKNNKYIIDILKFQDDYSIWNIDGSLNEYRFKDMMIEIKGL